MIKLTITEENFIDWYFNEGQDSENESIRKQLSESVIEQLKYDGRAIVDLQDIFYNCDHGAIKINFLQEKNLLMKNEDDDSEVGDVLENFQIKLLTTFNRVDEAKKFLENEGYDIKNLKFKTLKNDK